MIVTKFTTNLAARRAGSTGGQWSRLIGIYAPKAAPSAARISRAAIRLTAEDSAAGDQGSVGRGSVGCRPPAFALLVIRSDRSLSLSFSAVVAPLLLLFTSVSLPQSRWYRMLQSSRSFLSCIIPFSQSLVSIILYSTTVV
ncbi:hypothetical protein K438DRAFT_223420 [Mycena galopus ATCC 62051]|nr:hypothetical protein K438DRAFT_223420 [Mycena galopus ATCC 62051]